MGLAIMRSRGTGSRRRRSGNPATGVAGALGTIVAVACLAWTSPLPGQEAPPAADSPSSASSAASYGFVFRSDDRPRLGVYLRPGCEIAPAPVEACRTPPVVAGVVDGAPAATAGIQPGDTLLSIDGVSLRSAPGRRAMAELEARKPVRLEIGRSTGRRTVVVTPVARPMTSLFQMSGTPWQSPRTDVHVYRLRDAEGGVAEFHLTPTPERPTAQNRFVVFREDESGTLRVDVGHPDVQVFAPDGRRLELAELERSVQAAGAVVRVAPSAEAAEAEPEARARGERREPPRSLIIENAPLARRLESVHRGTLLEARSRIDSVLESRALVRRGEAPPAAPRGEAVVSGDDWRHGLRATLRPGDAPASSELRIAGAEFRALSAELAEYFPVDEGLLVLRVIAETPADRLGLRGGDVVVEAGGHNLRDVNTFRRLLLEAQATATPLVVKWNRKGNEMSGRLSSP